MAWQGVKRHVQKHKYVYYKMRAIKDCNNLSLGLDVGCNSHQVTSQQIPKGTLAIKYPCIAAIYPPYIELLSANMRILAGLIYVSAPASEIPQTH